MICTGIAGEVASVILSSEYLRTEPLLLSYNTVLGNISTARQHQCLSCLRSLSQYLADGSKVFGTRTRTSWGKDRVDSTITMPCRGEEGFRLWSGSTEPLSLMHGASQAPHFPHLWWVFNPHGDTWEHSVLCLLHGQSRVRVAQGRTEFSAISEQLSQQHVDKDVLYGPSPVSSNSLGPSSLQEQE